jgi:hypothetical protein
LKEKLVTNKVQNMENMEIFVFANIYRNLKEDQEIEEQRP